jgi:chromosome segregation ATPase
MFFKSKRYTLAAAATSALVLAGCTGETDPSQAGLFDNINNISSGEYDNQIAAGEAEAQRIVRDNQSKQSSIASLNRQENANSATTSRLKGQLASAQSELNSARAKVAGNAAKTAQLNGLQSQLSSIQKASASGGTNSVLSAELSGIRRSIRLLTK